jgi:hypothetical protein
VRLARHFLGARELMSLQETPHTLLQRLLRSASRASSGPRGPIYTRTGAARIAMRYRSAPATLAQPGADAAPSMASSGAAIAAGLGTVPSPCLPPSPTSVLGRRQRVTDPLYVD